MKQTELKVLLVSLFAGFLFGLGLTISGMTIPSRVVGFLDVTGTWDPTLAFVMISGIAVNLLSFRFILRRKNPVFTQRFWVPTRREITKNLFVGSTLFGMGWALSGFCPGPAIVSLATGSFDVILFCAAMYLGMRLENWWALRKHPEFSS